MTKKGNLFNLIKSLSQAEKRYFKIFCFSNKVSVNYQKLFDALESQTVFDEAAIRKKFKKENFIKQLHVTKNYLYNLILKSLRNYHAKFSKNAELKDTLRNVELLYQRKLFDLCYYEIEKAEKMAIEFEQINTLLEVYNWKRKLIIQKYRAQTQREILNRLLEKEKQCIEQMQSQNEYWYLTINVFDQFQNNKEALLNNPLLNDNVPITSLQSKTLYHHLKYTTHVINNEPEKGLSNLKQLAELLTSFPRIIQDDPSSYISVLNNTVSFHIFQGSYSEVPMLLKKIREIPEKYKIKSTRINISLWLRSYNVELEMYRDTKAFKKAINIIPDIESFMQKNKNAISKEYSLMLWYQFAYIYFMDNNFNQSLKWVNKIINTKFDETRQDLASYARLLNLMIHFELNNIIVMRYAVESSRRFLKRKKKITPFENELLRFFSKISLAPSYEYKEYFKALYDKLFNSEPKLVTKNMLDYLDFKSWIESKL